MARDVLVGFDLGAESGRTVAGAISDDRIEITELSRFPNVMVSVRGHLHWDVLHLLREIEKGLAACASEAAGDPAGIAVDTWGVDFGLLGSDGSLLGMPYVYRDKHIEGAMEGFFERIPRERVYELTGIQLIPINTLFQLYAMRRDRSPVLGAASDLLFTPDLFTYLLSGAKVAESSIASTSQLYNPLDGAWEPELFQALDLPLDLMQDVVPSGTVAGDLDPDIASRVGLRETPIIAAAGHDTAAAVAAAPAEGADWAYISSGTWSLMGVESARPIITQQSLDFNFTNEAGVGGTFRVLKNIMGLWLVQQCRKSWAKERTYTYEELTEMAAAEQEPPAIIDPDHGSFLNPPDMPQAIAAFCEATGQKAPETPAAFIRCVLVSLALKYRLVLDQLRELYDHPINRIHVIGGGVKNELLCQLTADATRLPVIAGPVEATATGNLLVQAMALGRVQGLADIRTIVRRSFPVVRYEPRADVHWEDLYQRFRQLAQSAQSQEDVT